MLHHVVWLVNINQITWCSIPEDIHFLSHHHYFGTLSLPFEVIFGVLQGCVLGLLLFKVFINDLCNIITFSGYVHFADYITISQIIESSQ
jgi:hypothetical protein